MFVWEPLGWGSYHSQQFWFLEFRVQRIRSQQLYHEVKQETDHKELTIESVVLKPYHLGDFCERTEEKCSTSLVRIANNISTQEGEAGGWLCVQGQHGLYKEVVAQRKSSFWGENLLKYSLLFKFAFNKVFVLFVCLFVWDRVSLCDPGCPGTCSVDQTGLELTEILLSLPLKCWD